jgi:hypothetical protein
MTYMITELSFFFVDRGQLVLSVQKTTTANGPSDKKNTNFSDTVKILLPEDILEAMEEPNKESFMTKVKNAGETTWAIFKKMLKAVEAASSAHPGLEIAVKGLLKVLDQFDASSISYKDLPGVPIFISIFKFQIMKDTQDDLFFVSQKILALHSILNRYSNLDIPEAVSKRMNGIAE